MNRDRTSFGVLAGVALLALVGGGCQDQSGRTLKGESIFEFFAPPTPQEAVAWAADPYDADKRYRGLLLVANAPWGGEGPYLRMYELAASDPDEGVRAMALRALAMHGTQDHAALVTERLRDDSDLVRWEAARAMQRMFHPPAVPALLERLTPAKEQNVRVRTAVARALGQYDQARVVQGLIAALRDRSLAVNTAAEESLRTLTGQAFGLDGTAWTRWAAQTTDMFAQRGVYTYPVFERDKRFWEWLPFIPGPPNEVAGTPIGAPPPAEPPVEQATAGDAVSRAESR